MDIVFYNLLKYLYTCLEYLNEYRISEGKFECKRYCIYTGYYS